MRCCSKDKLSIKGAPMEKEIRHICPSKLSKRELQDLYFKLMQDNVELKQTVNQLSDQARRQTTRLQRMLAAQKAYMNNDTKDCCAAAKAIVQEQKNLIEDLKNDNENLKAQLKNLNMKLCSTKQFLSRPPAVSTPRDHSKWPASGRIKNSLHPGGPNVAKKDREPDSAKNSTSSANTKKSEVPPTDKKSVSSENPVRSAPNSPKSDRKSKTSPKTETAPNIKTDNSDNCCDQNKCQTQMEEFQQKILDLQKELSKAHEAYSDRIARLEHDVVELHSENMRVRSEKALWEHTNNARENEANEMKKKLEENEAYSQGLSARLNIEKGKVAELKTRIKADNMTNGAVKAIEEQLLNDNINKEIPLKLEMNDTTNPEKDDRRSCCNEELKKDLKRDSNARRDSNATNGNTTVGNGNPPTKIIDPSDNSKPWNLKNEQQFAPETKTISMEETCCASTESPRKNIIALHNDIENAYYNPNMNPNVFDTQGLNNGQTDAASNGTSPVKGETRQQIYPKATMSNDATDSELGDTQSNEKNLRSPDEKSTTPNILYNAKLVDKQCGNQTDDVEPLDITSRDKRSSIRVQVDEIVQDNCNRLGATKDSLTVVKERKVDYPPPDESRRTSKEFSTTLDSPKTPRDSISENKTSFKKKDIITEVNEKQEEVASSPFAQLVNNSNESSQCVNTTKRSTLIGNNAVPVETLESPPTTRLENKSDESGCFCSGNECQCPNSTNAGKKSAVSVFAPTQAEEKDFKESPWSAEEQTLLQKFVALFTPVNEDETKIYAKTNQPLMESSEPMSSADVSTPRTADTSMAKLDDESLKPGDTCCIKSSSIKRKHSPKTADVSIANTTDTSTVRTTDDDSGFNEVSKFATTHEKTDLAKVNAGTTDTQAAAKISDELSLDVSDKNATTNMEKGLARVNQDLMNKVADLQAQLDQLRVHVLSRKDTYTIFKDDATQNHEEVTKDTGTTTKEYSNPPSPSHTNCESTFGMSRKTSDDSNNNYNKRRNSQRKDNDNRYQIPGPIPVAGSSRKTQPTNSQSENIRHQYTPLQPGGSSLNLNSNRQNPNFHERFTKMHENPIFVKEESPTNTNPSAQDYIVKSNAQFVKKPQEILKLECACWPRTLDNLNTRETASVKPEQISVADANVYKSTAYQPLAEENVETRDPIVEQGTVKTLKNAKHSTKHCTCPTALKSPMKCKCSRYVEYTMNVIHACTAARSPECCTYPKIHNPKASSTMTTEDILSSNVLPVSPRRNSNVVTATNWDIVGPEQKPDHIEGDKSRQSTPHKTSIENQMIRKSQNSIKPINQTQSSTDPLFCKENKIQYENRTFTNHKIEQLTEPPMDIAASNENQVDKKITPQKCASLLVTSTPKQLGGGLKLDTETDNLQRKEQSDGDRDKGTSPRTYTIPLAPADIVQDAPDKKATHENTDEEISSMTDLPSEKETMTSPRQDIQSRKKELSLGEDRTTTTTSTSGGEPSSINPKTTSFSLSEGEMPHYSKRSSLTRDERTDQALIDERQMRMDKSEILEKALMTISEELARCRQLLSKPREVNVQNCAKMYRR